MMTKKKFYALSFTWGLIMVLAGAVVALWMTKVKHIKPKRYGWVWCFENGRGWGGLSLGLVFLCQERASEHTKAHEFGHAIQNARLGPAAVILTLASAARYWYYTIMEDWLGKNLPDYDSWWFEGQATALGKQYISAISEDE